MGATGEVKQAAGAGGAGRDQRRGIVTDALRAVAPAFATVIVFSFFINLLMFVSPLYMLQIYDRVITSRNVTTLLNLTILAVALIGTYACLEMLRSRVLVRAGIMYDEKIAGPLFNAVHAGILRQPRGDHTQCLKDLDRLREFLTGNGMIAFCDAPWFPVFVAAAFLLHPWFGYIALAASLLTLGLTLLNEFVTRTALDKASRASAQAGRSAETTLRNTEVLQAMGMLSPLRAQWATHHDATLALQAVASDRAGVIIASTKFVRIFTQVAILGTGAYLAIIGEASPGAMIAASILVGRAMAPIELAVANWKGFIAARASYRRLKALFEAVGSPAQRVSLPRPTGAISVDKVIAAPPGQEKAVLRGVSFAVNAGEIVGIIGPSAAGKSSLARVLVGVWPILAGAVRFDGSQISHWDPQELGRHVGYLPQDVELFPGTVAQNIARFQSVDDESIIAAARLAGCHDMIQELSEGYNTQIGEQGAILSGGQRQRIGLARALHGQPSVIVLDEPNASLDAAGETALLGALRELRAMGTTIALVSHKLNVLSVADKILLINAGLVQAFGNRDEVLSKLATPRIVASGTPNPAEPMTAKAE